MDINKKNRSEVKEYFKAEAQPTEKQFSEFIDATINQADDGIVKLPGNPLAIKAEGGIGGPQEIVHLYSDFSQNDPSWSFNLNPRVISGEEGSNKEGLNIKDAVGETRLFLQSDKGNIGMGTIEPVSTLTIQSSDEDSIASILDNKNQSTKIFEVSKEQGTTKTTVRNAAANKATHIKSNSITFENTTDKENLKSVAITAEEKKLAINAEEVTISGNVSMNNLSANTELAENGVSSDTIIPSQKAVKQYIDTRLPTGLISMWSGTEIPQGWALCNGENNTPDLSGRFIVGLDKTVPEYDEVTKTGGEKEVQLSVDQLPAHTHEDTGHSHGINDPGHNHNDGAFKSLIIDDNQGTIADGVDSQGGDGTQFNLTKYGNIQHRATGISIRTGNANLGNTGGNQHHENRPPYFVLAYIIKL